MQVRLLRPTDVEMANEFLRQLGYDMPLDELASRIVRVLAAEGHYAAVADDGKTICGLIHVYERPALEKPCEAVVQSLVVDRRARKRGVGRVLMAAAEAWAHTHRLQGVVLHTRIDREDACAFYEHLGYKRAATAYLMSKRVEHPL